MARKTVSDSVIDDLVQTWRVARLSSDSGLLSWPKISILGRIAKFGPYAVAGARGGRPMEPQVDEMNDAIRVQTVLDRAENLYKSAFEAYHLGFIDGERHHKVSHKARAAMLGVSVETYYRRVRATRSILQEELRLLLDR